MTVFKRTLLPIVTLALVGIPASPALVQAQFADDAADSQWMAWFGCWEAADNAEADEDNLLVCFEPLPRSDGVEIRTLMDGEVVAVEEVIADGSPTPAAEGGCEGERTASWSADGARVFVGSTLDCGAEVRRTSAGIMALTWDGQEWLEIHSVKAGDREPTLGVRRFVPASAEALDAHGVEPYGSDRGLAISTARTQASAPLGPEDVAEVVRKANSHVARALVAEIGEPFELDAGTLQALADEGVPPEVLDVMVAVTYPERFEIEGGSWQAEESTPAARTAQQRARAPWPATRGTYRGYSPWDLHWYSWYRSGYYGSAYRGWNPYWDPYWSPRVVVVEPRVRDRRGSVDPDRGYTSTHPSSRPATRRGQPSRASGSRPPSASSGSAAGSGSSRATPQGRSGSSGGKSRPAKRRGGGGGGG